MCVCCAASGRRSLGRSHHTRLSSLHSLGPMWTHPRRVRVCRSPCQRVQWSDHALVPPTVTSGMVVLPPAYLRQAAQCAESTGMLPEPGGTDIAHGSAFHFDKVFPPTASQEAVFAELEPLLSAVTRGKNGCVFAVSERGAWLQIPQSFLRVIFVVCCAVLCRVVVLQYGATGSGKTYTMEGSLAASCHGVIQRSVESLLAHCTAGRSTHSVHMACFEIYNDVIRDLLSPPPKAGTADRDSPTASASGTSGPLCGLCGTHTHTTQTHVLSRCVCVCTLSLQSMRCCRGSQRCGWRMCGRAPMCCCT